MKYNIISALFLVVSIFPVVSFACINDTDCAVGSRCVKPNPSSFNGICAGGQSPGNSNDRAPASAFPSQDPMGTYGSTCVIDPDCAPGQRCLKEGGQRYGVCVRK